PEALAALENLVATGTAEPEVYELLISLHSSKLSQADDEVLQAIEELRKINPDAAKEWEAVYKVVLAMDHKFREEEVSSLIKSSNPDDLKNYYAELNTLSDLHLTVEKYI